MTLKLPPQSKWLRLQWLRLLSERGVQVEPVVSRKKGEYDEYVRYFTDKHKKMGKTLNKKKIRHSVNRCLPSYAGTDKPRAR